MIRSGRQQQPPPGQGGNDVTLLLTGLVLLTMAVCTGWASGPDRALLEVAQVPQGTVSSWMARLVVWGGQFWLVGLVCGVSALLLARRERSWRPAVAVGVALVSVNVSVFVLKWASGRTAPAAGHDAVFADGWSYPSGHAATAALGLSLLCALASAWRRRQLPYAGTAVLVGAGAVGVATIALGYHWPTDVLAGWLVGALGARLTLQVWRPDQAGPRHTLDGPADAAGVNDPAGAAAPRLHRIGHRS